MTQTYAEGIYGITIGGDDGVRLSIDGGATYVLQDLDIMLIRQFIQRLDYQVLIIWYLIILKEGETIARLSKSPISVRKLVDR